MAAKTTGVVLVQSREAQEKQGQTLVGMGEFRMNFWESKEKGKGVFILSSGKDPEPPL